MNYLTQAQRIAPTSARVLILGQTGTGKTRLASEIHKASGRLGPFVTCDCGALSRDLAESHLFGHVKGAFSGAVTDHAGFFEQADGGTLFLDEIGELPLDLQPKLLRAVETGIVRRLGAKKDVQVSVRVICATHRDLNEMVGAGKFRQDLYYRVKGAVITMPALKDRRSEIPGILAGVKGLEPDVAAALASADCDWPGNVRQLLAVASLAAELHPSPAEAVAQVEGNDQAQTRAGKLDSKWTPRSEAVRVIEAVVALAQRPQGVSTGEVMCVGRYRHAQSASRMLSAMASRGILRRARNGIYFCAR